MTDDEELSNLHEPMMVSMGQGFVEWIEARRAKAKKRSPAHPPNDERALPLFLTVEEVAGLLRKPSVSAVYADVERGLIAGVIRRGSKILVERDVLLKALRSGK